MHLVERIERFLSDGLHDDSSVRKFLRKVPDKEWNVFRTHVRSMLRDRLNGLEPDDGRLDPVVNADEEFEDSADRAASLRVLQLKEKAFLDEDHQRWRS